MESWNWKRSSVSQDISVWHVDARGQVLMTAVVLPFRYKPLFIFPSLFNNIYLFERQREREEKGREGERDSPSAGSLGK